MASDVHTSAQSQTKSASSNPLSVHNFRLVWVGESISLLGDQFYMIALPWLVLQLTGDALALGTVMALAGIPRALFILVGGVFVDRFSPRAIMFASNLARMVLVALLGGVVLAGSIELWMLYLFGLAFGVADAFFYPGHAAIVPQLLDENQLQTGNALVQGTAQLSLFIGPVLAGVMIALLGDSGEGTATDAPGLTGIGIAFGLDALSFLASLGALWRVQVRQPHQAAEKTVGVLESIRKSMAYVWDSTVLKMCFFLVMAIDFLAGGPFGVGIPVLADTRLDGGAAAFGIVMSAFGGGALVGIVLAGVLPRPKPASLGALTMSLTASLGLGLILMPLSRSTAVVALISLIMGTGNGYVGILLVTWLQKRIPSDLMGRIMSLIMFASVGLAPVSSTVAGAIIELNLTALFVGTGVLLAAITLYAATLPVMRQMGLETAGTEQPLSVVEAIRKTGELPVVKL